MRVINNVYKYELIRSNRKTIEMSISRDLKIIVRAPKSMSVSDIDKFVEKHEKWIEKHLVIAKNRYENDRNKALSELEISKLKNKALEIISQRVEYYSNLMKLRPTGIKITSAMTRWGSCSSKNSLCFSYRLMQYPIEAIDYVVVHELVHIKIKNHSNAFYQEIEKYMPDYKERVKMLSC